MTHSIFRTVFILIACMSGAGVAGAAPQASGPDVVAEIGGRRITRAEMERKQSSKLLQARNQYYLAEKEALSQFVDEYLLEEKARREGISVEDLLKRDIESKITDPTEDQLKVYYEGLGTEEPYEAVRDKILGYIRQHRIKQARTDYLKVLRDQAGVMISLAPPVAEVGAGAGPLRGPREPAVTVVEFADYECPYCQQIDPLVKKLEQEFDGKIAVAFRDFPLPMHRRAGKAAEATRCAGAQGRYWELHDLLFTNPTHLELSDLKQHARTLKLDAARFDQCLDSGEQIEAVKKDVAEAQRLGLTGTPSFFVNGHFVSGAVKYETLRDMVQRELTATTAAANKKGPAGDSVAGATEARN